MFSAELLDHFRHPRNAGDLTDATASVEVSNPVCGDVLRLAVKTEEGRIKEARFLCRGCTTSIACASLLTELLAGLATQELKNINVEVFSARFGGLPAETIHGAFLAVDAVRALATQIEKS